MNARATRARSHTVSGVECPKGHLRERALPPRSFGERALPPRSFGHLWQRFQPPDRQNGMPLMKDEGGRKREGLCRTYRERRGRSPERLNTGTPERLNTSTEGEIHEQEVPELRHLHRDRRGRGGHAPQP